MTTISIRDITVKFPFTPYAIQRNYMEKVIECLQTKQNGILESPTGTGKTLSLLCASLAWLEHSKNQHESTKQLLCSESFDLESFDCTEVPKLETVPRIIYASRTHTQLVQAMQEMKRTEYSHFKACVLGSREQMCIDEEVKEETSSSAKITICKTKVKRGQCRPYKNVEKQKQNPDFSALSIVDMEDIVNLGGKHCFCPYYMARELKAKADVIFMPYNYLLDPRTSKSMGIELNQNIVIFDEAHNIEKVCEDSVSVELKTVDLQNAIGDVEAITEIINGPICLDEEINFEPDDLDTLNQVFITLKQALEETRLVKLANEGAVFDGDYIYELLEKAGINEQNYNGVSQLIENVCDFLASTRATQRSGYSLELFNDLLYIVFYKMGDNFRRKVKDCFKVRISEERSEWKQSQYSQYQRTCRVLHFWCFSPGFGMNILMDHNLHSVILTSGTLAPLKPLISELELDVGVLIENPHIVKSDQVCVKILSKGPDLQLLNSNFQNRSNPKYIQSLGLVISNLVRVIPDGILVFFPSYSIMEACLKTWQGNGTWNAISGNKPIYVEPKDKVSFTNAMTNYYVKIKDPTCTGAIFMGVCRGKISEGLDFADTNGRAVFITGLPYPPLRDPKVILKKRYLDFRHSQDKEYLRGDDWYSLEATRAINQAIGRVIRHKNDYGAIILLDQRFTNPRVKNNLSLWLRHYIEDMDSFAQIIKGLRVFFKEAEEGLVKVHIKGRDMESPSKRHC